MIPFIYLFKSPNNCYFYDVNKDSVVSISDTLYAYLDSHKEIPAAPWETDEPDISDRETLRSLMQRGYLSDHRVKEIRHLHTADLKFQIENRMSELLLQVTQSCNLVCSYCPYANKTDHMFQRNHSSKKMSWETAQQSIDLFADCSAELDHVALNFYGGEPFLNFGLIRQAVAYANKVFVGKRIDYSLTTNGTLLTDEIIEFLCSNHFSVLFSIDGPASVHDRNRKKSNGSGSYQEAVTNLKKLYSAYGELADEKLAVNSVINTETDYDEVLHLFDDPFFLENHIRFSATVVSAEMLEKAPVPRDDFWQKFNYRHFIALMKELGIVKDIQLDPISELFARVQLDRIRWHDADSRPLGKAGAPGGPCIPGQRRLFVNADGDLYPCERINELADDSKIGNIKTGIHLKRAERLLNIAQLTEQECRNCFAFRHCTVCAAKASGENGITVKHKLSKCAEVKKGFINQIRLIALKQEIDEHYKRYLPL